jgi:hypothetical protein
LFEKDGTGEAGRSPSVWPAEEEENEEIWYHEDVHVHAYAYVYVNATENKAERKGALLL